MHAFHKLLQKTPKTDHEAMLIVCLMNLTGSYTYRNSTPEDTYDGILQVAISTAEMKEQMAQEDSV